MRHDALGADIEARGADIGPSPSLLLGDDAFAIRDPDGNALEISAELELMPIGMAHRQWPYDARTLNLWGDAWFRSEP